MRVTLEGSTLFLIGEHPSDCNKYPWKGFCGVGTEVARAASEVLGSSLDEKRKS